MLAAAVTVAAVLIAPSVANAKIFTVSRDVTIYATPNTSKPLRPYPAGGRVDVRCYTKGETIEGYAVWDQIKNGNDGLAYVHDKYVDMGGTPQANGISPCPGGAQPSPQPQPGLPCVRAKRIVRYLSERLPLQPDHSYAKLTWEPRMCKHTDGWVLMEPPELDDLPAGRAFGIGIDLESVNHDGPTASYHGQIVGCLPFSISYRGIGFSGESCRSVGTVDLAATVGRNGKIGTPSLKSKGKEIADYEWSTDVF